MITAPRRSRHRLRFRYDVFERVLAERDKTTDAARAEFLGITQSQYTRCRNGNNLPGEIFVAAVLAALPHVSFDRLFEVFELKDDES